MLLFFAIKLKFITTYTSIDNFCYYFFSIKFIINNAILLKIDFHPELFERELPVIASDSQVEFGVRFEWRLTPKFEARMRKRIVALLGACVKHGHDAVVLSAFGCG